VSEPVTPWWVSWVLPAIAVLGVLWAMVKKIFTNAVREETEYMHNQNQQRLLEVESRLSEIECSVASIEGYIKGLAEKQ
jgi:hypothetical protein